jgi:alpha-2-macroglobulin
MERLRPYLRLRYLNIALIVLVLIAAGFVFGPAAIGGPAVVEITPADGAVDANPQGGIQILFSQWVQPDSVRDAVRFDPPLKFTVTEPGIPRAGSALVIVQPNDGLRYGAPYSMTIGPGVRNMLGRTLEQPASIAFTTAPYVTVARFMPESAARDVPLSGPITVEFGAPIVPAEQIAAAAQDPRLAGTLPQPVTLAPAAKGVGRWLSPTQFGFYPDGALRAATSYTVNVQTDVTPDGRARLEQPLAWSFTTAAPLLAAARPFDGATDVPAAGEVEVRLEPDVDVASAGGSFGLRESESGATVAGLNKKPPGAG